MELFDLIVSGNYVSWYPGHAGEPSQPARTDAQGIHTYCGILSPYNLKGIMETAPCTKQRYAAICAVSKSPHPRILLLCLIQIYSPASEPCKVWRCRNVAHRDIILCHLNFIYLMCK